MSRPRLIISIVMVTIAALVTWKATTAKQPSYEDKTLGYWLSQTDASANLTPQASNALKHIGSDACPTLVRMLHAKDHSPAVGHMLGWLHIQHPPAALQMVIACQGFEILGAQASDAVPDMIRLFKNDADPQAQWMTALAIGGIGPAASNAIPALLPALNSTNFILRRNTLEALGKIHSQPDLVVPQLVRALDDQDGSVKVAAFAAIAQYRTNGRLAVPKLKELMNSTNSLERSIAPAVLEGIDPAAVNEK